MAANNTPSTNASGRGGSGGQTQQMDKRLMKAASCGDSTSLNEMASQDPSIHLGTTPSGNNCLHISSIHGHEGFCRDVLELDGSLINGVNLDEETPLIAAVTCDHVSLASFLLGHCCSQQEFRRAVLQQDRLGFNALHHAVRCGHRDLAMQIIAAEPALSKSVNKFDESPMYMAAMRDFTDVFNQLLSIPDSSHAGPYGRNALHAAVTNGDAESATRIMGVRPEMARAADKDDNTPVRLAVLFNKICVLQVLLQHDCSLGYELNKEGSALLISAAYRGHIDIAREILNYCPDAPYRGINGLTLLHTAVWDDHAEFVEFILMTPQLRKVINMQDSCGKTALHYAVQKCNSRMVSALLCHDDIDAMVLENNAHSATTQLWLTTNHAKTLNWNEVSMLMLKACPQEAGSIHNLHGLAKKRATDASRKDAKQLTQTYTSNTSLVAILIATITFAAAFTLPGGYSSGDGSEGEPIMSKKFAFQAFLISDVLAMCSSFVVAFICIIARWEDYEFLIYYRSFTKKLMWFAFMATTTAFSTGLYTVLAPRVHWLAIAICVLVASLPIITWLLGEWPVLTLRLRLGKTFNSDLLDMV